MGSVLVPGIINQVKTRLPGRWPTLAPAQLFVTKRLSPANPWSRYCCLLRLDPPPRFSFSIVIRNIRCYVRHYVIPRYIYIYIVSHRFDNLVIWIVGKIVEWRSWEGDENCCSFFMRSIVLISIDEREREREI